MQDSPSELSLTVIQVDVKDHTVCVWKKDKIKNNSMMFLPKTRRICGSEYRKGSVVEDTYYYIAIICITV